jgi:c-di-AMP phosphodiesterase-like protein
MKNESHGSKMHATKHMPKLLTGSTTDMYAVVMDNGKTVIYISDKSRENEIRQKYTMQRQQVNVK